MGEKWEGRKVKERGGECRRKKGYGDRGEKIGGEKRMGRKNKGKERCCRKRKVERDYYY